MIGRLGLYWRTLRHLRPGQMTYRATYMVERKIPALRARHVRLASQARNESCGLNPDALGRTRGFLASLGRHQPELPLPDLNNLPLASVSVDLHAESTWTRADIPMLDRYVLHYFDWILPMALRAVTGDAAEVAALHNAVSGQVAAWERRFPIGTPIAWDAFPCSKRIQNLLLAMAAAPDLVHELLPVLNAHAAWLMTHVEHDVSANHLLKNAVALMLAGKTIRSDIAVRVARSGARIFARELAEQVLPDGGHYERSPMYHLHAMSDIAMVFAICGSDAGISEQVISRMADYLDSIRHPDGNLPQFGDCALETPQTIDAWLSAVRDLAGAKPNVRTDTVSFADTGIYAFGNRAQGDWMVFKASPLEPAHQPGHAHCDLGSYELSVKGSRIVVDSGVGTYEAGDWRNYYRSARAHNVTTVDDREVMEYWGSFRVGRRFEDVRVVSVQLGGQTARIGIEHEAYAPVTMRREVVWLRDKEVWMVADRLRGPDEFLATTYLHFHPDYTVALEGEGWVVSKDGQKVLWVFAHGSGRSDLVHGLEKPLQGWCAEHYGAAKAGWVLTLRTQIQGDGALGYALCRQSDAAYHSDLRLLMTGRP